MILGTYAHLEVTSGQQSGSDIQIERKPEIIKILKKDSEPNDDLRVKSLVKLTLLKTDESMKDNHRPKEMKSVEKAQRETKKESKLNEEPDIEKNIVDSKKLPSNDEQNQSDEFFEDVVYTEY